MIEIEEKDGVYYIVNAPHEKKEGAINYAARLERLSIRYNFKRKFLKGIKAGQYMLPHRPSVGDIFEISSGMFKNIKHANFGKNSRFYIMRPDNILEQLSNKEVLAHYLNEECDKKNTQSLLSEEK
jgi:hypothetical protein